MRSPTALAILLLVGGCATCDFEGRHARVFFETPSAGPDAQAARRQLCERAEREAAALAHLFGDEGGPVSVHVIVPETARWPFDSETWARGLGGYYNAITRNVVI